MTCHDECEMLSNRVVVLRYAVRESGTSVKLFKNFKERKSFKPDFGAEGIFGGHLLGVKTSQGLAFYSWEELELIRRIEIIPKSVSIITPQCM